MKKRFLASLGFTVAILPACNEATGPDAAPCDDFLFSYGAVGSDTVTLNSGVRYIEVKPGTGLITAAFGDAALVNFTGWRQSDAAFIDSSCLEGKTPLEFQVGDPRYIEGFSIGLVGMKAGGVRRVIIPSELAFREGTDVVFDLHLVEVE